MLANDADREKHARVGGSVRESPTHPRREADDLVRIDDVLAALDPNCQPAAQHKVDLFLLAVAVNSPRLPALERKQVHTEPDNNSKLRRERDGTLRTVERDRETRHTKLAAEPLRRR